MSAHTPGPWYLQGVSGRYAVAAPPHGVLAAVRYLGNAPERAAEEYSNAALMAAAPALAAALRECASMLRDNYEALGYATQPAAVDRAEEALAAAGVQS